METLPAQFSNAVSNVTISDDKEQRAIAAHSEVRELLEADATLKSWGITPLLIGSYGRQTARYPGKDVDIFLRFLNLGVASDPAVLYDAVSRVLIAAYGLIDEGGRVTPQPRSLKVDFAAPNAQADLAFSVDAVPAVPWGKDWAIPNRDRSTWQNESDRWVRTNPVEFGDASQTLSTSANSPVVNGRNAYKPVVRLLRQVRHVHLGAAKPGGLYVEVAAFEAWQSGRVTGDSWAELFASSLYEVSRVFHMAASEGLLDPILRTPLKPALETSDWLYASRTFGALATDAQEALRATPCAAAKTWRTILGTNDRGQVFPLPDGCSGAGVPLPAAAAVSATGPTRARGFALQ
ncbi:nucleotidyltransferase [Microbacterium sp. HD4P20]|uniref:nucleotidyltransferase domain-containing protein n=1 Tax=Microbacterium sp. HD4P20 TaxID=2864874 RepID=UPI001C63F890|nr:nucleotidyltransferase [Microbacterium sp. HD4P20]MCP2637660.1 nucleotidyltransferase [Microbacterium sp. HD4P20]